MHFMWADSMDFDRIFLELGPQLQLILNTFPIGMCMYIHKNVYIHRKKYFKKMHAHIFFVF